MLSTYSPCPDPEPLVIHSCHRHPHRGTGDSGCCEKLHLVASLGHKSQARLERRYSDWPPSCYPFNSKSARRIDIILKACPVSAQSHIIISMPAALLSTRSFPTKGLSTSSQYTYTSVHHNALLNSYCAHCATSNITANHSSPQEDLGRKKRQTQASDLAKLVMSNHLVSSSATTSSTSSPNILPNADRSGPAVKLPDGPLPLPALLPDGNISHALKALRDFDAIKRDRVAYDSPYALSTASTAPGSPRM